MKKALQQGDHKGAINAFSPDVVAQVAERRRMYHMLLQAWSRLGSVSKTFDTLKNMQQDGVVIGPEANNHVLYALGSTGRVEAARCYLLGRLKDAERPALLYNTVISSCLHHHRLDLANQLFRAMDNHGVQRDAVSWNLALRAQAKSSNLQDLQATIDAFQRSSHSQNLQARAAVSLADCMMQAGFPLDTPIQNTLLRAALKEGATAQDIQTMMNGMRAQGLHPNAQSYTILARAYQQQEDAEGATAVLSQMKAAGVLPSIQTWNAALETWAAQGNVWECTMLYSNLKLQSARPDICTFIALFRSLWASDPQSIDTASALGIPDMQRLGLQHNKPSFTALVQVYGRLGRTDEMLELLDGSKAQPSLQGGQALVSAQAFNAALGACATRGDVTAAQRLIRQMEGCSIEPTVHSYTALMYAHLTKRDAGPIFNLLKKMQDAGIQPTSETRGCLIRARIQLGEVKEAMLETDTMEGAGMSLSPIWGSLIRAARDAGLAELAHAAQERAKGNPAPWQALAQTFTYYSDDDDDDDLFS
ncbi:hypothetical protein WJX73_004372 [Symbiochloris irregularis]|uniref:PROP1-like PPR domain-containing protein n=1 Tax=Symbiochloris irregularis TaxID=706552 RepID=A0AAW1NQA6_9CHLO